jgi:Zn-dependent protease
VLPTRQGSLRLFRFAGIQVYLHWSWFLVAAYELSSRTSHYTSFYWNGLEYVSLFAIVLLHEFGHSLACRQVGGQADQIVLWPLGGVAYVNPPSRPGATLWSIAAGPLVNAVLFPIFSGLLVVSQQFGWAAAWPNLGAFLGALWFINGLLLVFNLLPVYPLDGGQILRSLLWFAMGRARSLAIATYIGFVGGAVLLVVALYKQETWIVIMALFMLFNCWGGLLHARLLARTASAPRHEGFQCPSCQAAPPQGEFWLCSRCRKRFDTFITGAICPHCGTQFGATRCLECGGQFPIQTWMVLPAEPPPLPPMPPPWPGASTSWR